MMRWRFALPLLGFVVLAGFLLAGLGLNPREVPSPLVDKPAPDFRLETLHEPGRLLARDELRGQVWVLNVWASWCVACREEHATLLELAKSGAAPVVGLNYKDATPDAIAWLERHGDPYRVSLADRDGRVGLDFGVYGVPETFVIDRQGVIRFKRIGPLTPELVRDKLEPLLRELRG